MSPGYGPLYENASHSSMKCMYWQGRSSMPSTYGFDTLRPLRWPNYRVLACMYTCGSVIRTKIHVDTFNWVLSITNIQQRGYTLSRVGTIKLSWKDDDQNSHEYLISNVLYFPQLPINILSIMEFSKQLKMKKALD